MNISLGENFRAIFYAPLYALRALDFATREGITVEWLPASSPGAVFDEVKEGCVDLAWGGPMRVMKDRDGRQATGSSLSCFGEIVSRDPFYLVARTGSDACGLAALRGARLAVVSEVPTPWLCLQADLRDAGIACPSVLDSCDVVTGLSMEQQLRALERRELDVVQLFEPYVSEAVVNGMGRVIYSASQRGPTLYTTFVCSLDGLARHREPFRRLSRALGRVQRWIATHRADELAEVVTPFFRDISTTLLRNSIRRYYQAGIWAHHTAISREGFDRLGRSLHLGGFIAAVQSYESCVAPVDECA